MVHNFVDDSPGIVHPVLRARNDRAQIVGYTINRILTFNRRRQLGSNVGKVAENRSQLLKTSRFIWSEIVYSAVCTVHRRATKIRERQTLLERRICDYTWAGIK